MALVRLCDFCLGHLTNAVALTPAVRAISLSLLRTLDGRSAGTVRTIHLCHAHIYRLDDLLTKELAYETMAAFVARADEAFANLRDEMYTPLGPR